MVGTRPLKALLTKSLLNHPFFDLFECLHSPFDLDSLPNAKWEDAFHFWFQCCRDFQFGTLVWRMSSPSERCWVGFSSRVFAVLGCLRFFEVRNAKSFINALRAGSLCFNFCKPKRCAIRTQAIQKRISRQNKTSNPNKVDSLLCEAFCQWYNWAALKFLYWTPQGFKSFKEHQPSSRNLN